MIQRTNLEYTQLLKQSFHFFFSLLLGVDFVVFKLFTVDLLWGSAEGEEETRISFFTPFKFDGLEGSCGFTAKNVILSQINNILFFGVAAAGGMMAELSTVLWVCWIVFAIISELGDNWGWVLIEILLANPSCLTDFSLEDGRSESFSSWSCSKSIPWLPFKQTYPQYWTPSNIEYLQSSTCLLLYKKMGILYTLI